MIVAHALHRPDGTVQQHPVEDLATTRSRLGPGEFQWVLVHEPEPSELADLARTFDIPPLAARRASLAGQRPRLETEDHTLVLVLRTLRRPHEGSVVAGSLTIFVAPDHVVTVEHTRSGSPPTPWAEHLPVGGPGPTGGPLAVVHAICARVLADHDAACEVLEDEVEEVEVSVFAEGRSDDAPRIHVLRREIAEAHRAIRPLRDPLHDLAAGEQPSWDHSHRAHFRDLSHHHRRTAEQVETLETSIERIFEAHVARLSLQQNDDMRKISAGAALVIVPTLIAGIYGMNFRHMPEIDWPWGYPFALGLMVATVVGLWVLFKHSRWL